MRICVITTVHPPKDVRIAKELGTLVAEGNEVVFIAPKGDFESKDIIFVPLERRTGRLKRLLRGPKEALKKALEADADVYHFHDPELIPLGLKLKRYGKKVIYDIHEDYPSVILSKKWIPKFLRSTVSKLVDKYERYAVRKFDGIVVVVPEQLDRFSDKEEVSILPNYPRIQYLESRRKTRSNKKVKFVYSGSIDIDRSIVEMIEAFKYLSEKYDIELNLLGPIHDIELKNLIFEVSERYDGLNYRGFLSYKDAIEFVSGCDVGLMVMHRGRSKEISSPLKMFEYLTLGLPIIASNFKKWRQTLDEKPCALYVEPDSFMDIASKMEILIKDTKLRKRLGANAVDISRKYSWKSIEDRLIKLYDELED